MSTLTYPGVYIEEIPSGLHTITGVATSIAAFVGWADQGPVDSATLVQSWPEYVAQFGGLDSRSNLGYAVAQFFTNGGSQCYIVRLVWDGTLTPASGTPAPCATALSTDIGYPMATFTASLGSVSGSITLGIGPAVLTSIALQPVGAPATMPPMPIGATVTLVAVPTYSDGGTSPALSGLTWSTSDETIIKVANGVVTAAGVGPAGIGTATVTATSGLISGSLDIEVTAASLTALNIVPAAPSVAVGETLQLSATATYTNGVQDITGNVGWSFSSATPYPAAFSNNPLTPGLLTAGATAATATITATVPWTLAGTPTSKNATLTVEPPAVLSTAIYPANPTLQSTETTPLPLQVWGIKSSVLPNPPPVQLLQADWNWSWVSSNTQVATTDATGNVLPHAVGTATLTATSGDHSLTVSTTVTVTAATLKSISLSPPTVTVAIGLSQQLKATGTYDDGSSADLTGSVKWSWPSDVTGSPGGLVTGAVLTSAPQTISAEWQGVSSSSPGVSVTVIAAVPESIKVTVKAPSTATSLTVGQPLALIATATLSNSTTQDVTAAASWTSSAPLTAPVPGGTVTASSAGAPLTLFAQNPGAWGNTLLVSVTLQPPPNTTNRFNLLVQQVGANGQIATLESFVNLSALPSDSRYVVTVVDNDSSYITFVYPLTGSPVVPTAAPGATAPVALSGGADGAVLTPASDQNFEIALTQPSTGGVYLLDRVDIFNLLCIPGETDATTISALQPYCNKKRALFIVDAPEFITPATLGVQGPVGTGVGGVLQGGITGTYASNSAYYFPWVLAPDPLAGNRPALFPPCGFVAGIYAATDATRGVWKAPAGINAGLSGNSGLQYTLTDAENGNLNPQAINCLRHFKVYGDVVWGARTLAGNDQAGSEWKYVPIRRLALFLESSLFDGTQWVVFEPNDDTLWGQVRLNVGTFMQGLFLQGAFAGTTPQQAYFVKCDGENNPPASVALGVVNILVGFAPLYPAEFVVIQIQQIVDEGS
jgi:phage tail sheath protein FI